MSAEDDEKKTGTTENDKDKDNDNEKDKDNEKKIATTGDDDDNNENDENDNNVDLSGEPISRENDKDLPLFVRVFNNSYIVFLLWFILIYLVVYVFFGALLLGSRDAEAERQIANTIDILVFVSVVLYGIYVLYGIDNPSQDSFVEGTKEFLREFYGNQLSLFSTMLFLITFYFLLFILRVPMSPETKPFSVKLIEFFGLLFLVSVFIYDFFKYLLGIDILGFLGEPRFNKLLNTVGAPLDIELEEPSQVFNVSNNYYTYDDARAVCSALDSRLATYDEIEKAYENGAEWCNYGWSEDQMAFFPTQKSTWNKLQETPLNKNNCGRPGVNGGFMGNPKIKFGVNCFGKKPKATKLEKEMMEAQQDQPVAKTKEEEALERKVKYLKDNEGELLRLNSFNKGKWSRF